jgi:hypothetical protein
MKTNTATPNTSTESQTRTASVPLQPTPQSKPSNPNAAIPHSSSPQRAQPSQQGNEGRPNPTARQGTQDAQQDITPNNPGRVVASGQTDTQYHGGRDPDPSKS